MDEVAALALALPEVGEGTSYGHRAWTVGGTRFAWARPFSKADVGRFGDEPVPPGEILAVVVDDLGERDAVLATNPDSFLTIPHLAGHAIVLIRLELVSRSALVEAIEDAWLATAPAPLVVRYRAG